jgi:1,4-alpha-glucan branching enzyme
VNFISSHDNQRLLYQLSQQLIFDDLAFERIKLAATLLMTAMGVPMVWMGTEFGESRELTGRIGRYF